MFNKKKYLGTLGDVGVFSFEFGKIITTGVGGMIFTNKKKIFWFLQRIQWSWTSKFEKNRRGNDKVKFPVIKYG